MLRIFLTIILPLLLPLLLYGGYIALLRRRAEAAGQETLPAWHDGPWVWVALGSAVLVVITLLAVRFTSGVEPGTKLEAPRVIDGRIEPSRVAE